ncbi:MAG: hypothetical protein V3U65_12415 [Granulosicoccaceae bacterium]
MFNCIRFSIAILFFNLLLSQSVLAAETHVHWVGMLPANFIELDSAGEIKEGWTIPFYAEPSPDSEKIGKLKVEIIPEGDHPVFANFIYDKTAEPIEVNPHLYDHDLGYGPYYHLTVIERYGGWFKVQFKEGMNTMWGDFASAYGGMNVGVLYLESGRILEWTNNKGEVESIYIDNSDPDTLVVRPEQPIDMGCDDETLRFKPYQTKLIPKSDWIDVNGRSRFDIYYTRGC